MTPATATARADGEHFAGLAAEKAERMDPGFSLRAQAFVLDFLKANGPATGEDVTDAAKAAGIVPLEDRAFGSIYASLARRGLIAHAGVGRRRKGRGTFGAVVWRAA